MKKINNITVGIDFSVAAHNAYRYARELAKMLGATLTLVHVKENEMIVSDVIIPSFPPADDEALIKEMKQLVTDEDTGAGQPAEVKIKILKGNAASVLSELPENTGTDLIILGTTGVTNLLTTLFGSTSLKVSNQAHCPVILVPMYTKWQPVTEVLFASDYDSMTAKFVNRITDFALQLNANIHFVNVRNYDPILEPKQKDIVWSELLADDAPDSMHKKSTIYGNDTVAELNKYSLAHNINLLAFASKHRHFWSNLTHKSISAGVSLSGITPVMIMHLDDEA
jgi:nucleotide-binding universal stress UspA family protein